MSIAAILDYRTPLRKLVQFFVRSRDKWNAKRQAAKRENKSLKIRLNKMRESRDRWRRSWGGCASSPPRSNAGEKCSR